MDYDDEWLAVSELTSQELFTDLGGWPRRARLVAYELLARFEAPVLSGWLAGFDAAKGRQGG